jgi:hypothetical protein
MSAARHSTTPDLYAASAPALLERLRSVPDSVESALSVDTLGRCPAHRTPSFPVTVWHVLRSHSSTVVGHASPAMATARLRLVPHDAWSTSRVRARPDVVAHELLDQL